MRNGRRYIGWFILVLGVFCFSSRLQQDYDVLFQDSAGDVINLTKLKGKVVVINYWAKWCLPCLAEMPDLNQLYLDLKDNSNIVFMAVDIEGDAEKGAHFMKKRKFSIPVYHIKTELPEDLRTSAIPTTIILDKKGLLLNKHVGIMNFKSVKFKEALRQLGEE